MPLQLIRQDITKVQADAIVNTTNREMIGYSGVDMAIHRAAGAALDEECLRRAPLREGEVIVTDGYALPCKYIIHAIGPTWRDGEGAEREKLAECYISALGAAFDRGCETVALPLISAGVHGYPKDQALRLAVNIITDFLFDHELTVYLCVFDSTSYKFSRKLFLDIRSYIDDNYAKEHRSIFSPFRSNRPPRGPEEPDGSVFPAAPPCAGSFAESRPFPSSTPVKPSRPAATEPMPPAAYEPTSPAAGEPTTEDLDEWIKSQDAGFAQTLFAYIDASGLSDVACYKRANIDKKTFWKIKNVEGYRPSKQTAVAFAVALRLSPQETRHLLGTAGMSLSHSFRFDLIIEYFITHGKYDIFDINEALLAFDQPLLGSF